MLVHPAFDVETRTWFTDEGHEAPSLRQLKQSLPEGSKIVGYHPNGFKMVWEGSLFKNSIKDLRVLMHTNYKPNLLGKTKLVSPVMVEESKRSTRDFCQDDTLKVKNKSGPKPKIRRLTEWSAKLQRPKTPKKAWLGPQPTWELRSRTSWSNEDDVKLKSMADQGATSFQIARELKTTRNAVIGRCHRLGIHLKRKPGFGK